MARSTQAGAQAIPRAGCFDSSVAKELQNVFCMGDFAVLSGTADAVPFPGNVQITNASGDAATLATPLAGGQPGGDDGKSLFIIDNVGAAHTVTTAANKIINSKHIMTFNGTIGSNVELVAMGGIWAVVGTSGVTLS